MRELLMSDRWVTSPRNSNPSRPRSNREVFRPAVQDLSEQAARNGQTYQEEPFLSVVSTCTPRSSRPGTETYSDRLPPSTPFNCHDDVISSRPSSYDVTYRSTTNPQLCFNQHNSDYHEDLHRQRVLVSAHHRRKLHSIRRAKSTPSPHSRNGSASDIYNAAGQHRTSWQATEEEKNKFELVITNSMKAEDYEFKERINYRLTSRTKPKSAKATLVPAGGAPLPLLNGYNQTLIQNYPKYSQQYCRWLTNGLKVQSFRGNPTTVQYSHAKPAPTLVQYLNRPKTTNGTCRWSSKQQGPKSVDFNVVGVQKEMQNSDIGVQPQYNTGKPGAPEPPTE